MEKLVILLPSCACTSATFKDTLITLLPNRKAVKRKPFFVVVVFLRGVD